MEEDNFDYYDEWMLNLTPAQIIRSLNMRYCSIKFLNDQYEAAFQDQRPTFPKRRHSSLRKVHQNIERGKFGLLRKQLLKFEVLRNLQEEAIKRLQPISNKANGRCIQKIKLASSKIYSPCIQMRYYLRKYSNNYKKFRKSQSLPKPKTSSEFSDCKSIDKTIYFRQYCEEIYCSLFATKNLQFSLFHTFYQSYGSDFAAIQQNMTGWEQLFSQDHRNFCMLVNQDHVYHSQPKLKKNLIKFAHKSKKKIVQYGKKLKYSSLEESQSQQDIEKGWRDTIGKLRKEINKGK